MVYRVVIAPLVVEQLDKEIDHLLSIRADITLAQSFLTEIEKLITRISEFPASFPISSDDYLAAKEYREALALKVSYKIIFSINGDEVHILGAFHFKENYVEAMRCITRSIVSEDIIPYNE